MDTPRTQRRRRGMTMIGMVISLAVIAVLATVTVGATWRLTGTSSAGPSPSVQIDDIADADAAELAESGSGVVGAANATVVNSHAAAAAGELSANAAFDGDATAGVDAITDRYPQTVNSVAITATARAAGASTIIEFSDGAVSACVTVTSSGATTGPC